MENLTKCLCCGGESLYVGAPETIKTGPWISEKARGVFNSKGKYKLSSKLCGDCGYVHWFATGGFKEIKDL